MTKPSKLERNAGAVALACTGLSQALIAARLGMKDRTAITHWKSGRFKPRKAMREKMLAEFGIGVELWDLGAAATPKASKTRTSIPIPGELRAPKQSTPAALFAVIAQTVDYLEENRGQPAIERAQALLIASRALYQAHRLSGAEPRLSVRAIMNSRHWRPIERAMRDALAERYPDALAALDAAITKMYADDQESVIWNSPVREFRADVHTNDAPSVRQSRPVLPPSRPQPNSRRSRRGRVRDPFDN